MSALKKAFTDLKSHSRSGSQTRAGTDSDTDSGAPIAPAGGVGISKHNTDLSTASSKLSNGSTLNGNGHVEPKRGSIDRLRASLDHRPRNASTDKPCASIDQHSRSTHSPFGLFRKHKGHSSDSNSSMDEEPLSRDGEALSRNQVHKHERQAAREKHSKEVEERREAERKRKEEVEAKAALEETDDQRSKYGTLPINSYAGEQRNEAIRMLNETGWLDEHGKVLPEDEDLGTRDEIQLGRVIKEKLGTDYYVLDKFPASARPFYAMPDPHNPGLTNSFDIFCRGQEILSGGQRIHDAAELIKKMEALKMDPKSMEEYLSGFEWAAPPHGGGGIGLERILMLILQLGDIRHATLFQRDPRSLPAQPKVVQLRHPDSSTLHPPWSGQDRAAAHMEFQPLEELIANYGDASNTSWLEPKFEHYREPFTGAAIGFVPHEGFAITVGDPLCHESQYAKTIASYLKYIRKERHLKVLWLLCGSAVSDVLGTKFDWRTLSVAAEQRLNPGNNPAIHDSELQRKIRHAEKEGVKIHDIPIGTPPSKEIREKVDKRVEDWLAGRKGKQVHLTDVHPWQDVPHRQYHYSTTRDGTITGLVILAQLSPAHGWQIKFSLDFPGAPSGAIEALVMHSLAAAAATGAQSVTFGGGACAKLTPGQNLKGTRVKVLSKAYSAIAAELHLTNKSEFRAKLGAQEDPTYVCYPPHGLGPSGVRAILSFFEDDDEGGKV
ncbi:aspartate--tRNA ligase dps1 [Oleoguttula sp. CCFEE 5521]